MVSLSFVIAQPCYVVVALAAAHFLPLIWAPFLGQNTCIRQRLTERHGYILRSTSYLAWHIPRSTRMANPTRAAMILHLINCITTLCYRLPGLDIVQYPWHPSVVEDSPPWGKLTSRRPRTATAADTLLRGAIVFRTNDGTKNHTWYISVCIHTIIGSDY